MQITVRKHDVKLEGIGVVEISTSDLDYLAHDAFGYRPETCLFWERRGRRESVVVERYGSWPEAIQGHVAWTADTGRVAKAIVDHLKDRAQWS
jgi:hypothetical protein